jgi:hypothetical protein
MKGNVVISLCVGNQLPQLDLTEEATSEWGKHSHVALRISLNFDVCPD